MIDVSQKKEKIISFLNRNGPSLPVRVAKEIDLSPVFASAILSELLQTKEVTLSSMKIGSSPLYLIPGKEDQLERYIDHLKGVEKEVLIKLRTNKTLVDQEQEPATRIALRNLKDFAKPSKEGEKIIWRYAFQKEESPSNPQKETVKENTEIKETKKEQKAIETPKVKKNQQDEKTSKKESKEIEQIPEKKASDESDFEEDVAKYLKKKGILLAERIQSDKKEFIAKIVVPSNLKDLTMLLIAKNKRTITKDEINSAIQRSEYEKMPCLFLARKEPAKNAKVYAEDKKDLLFFEELPSNEQA